MAYAVVPADRKVQLAEEDKVLVAEAVDFVQDFVAELPVQVVATDFKSLEPDSVSGLAVRAVGDGRHVYAGSFDLLLRVRTTRSLVWKVYNGKEVAFDMKLTGAVSTLGIDSQTIIDILAHGQAVLGASQKHGGRLGSCSLVAYLIRRPPGITNMNTMHRGSWGFLLFDMDVFMRWNPLSKRAPRRLIESGTLIKNGRQDDLHVVPNGAPSGPALVVNPRPRRNRWADLVAVAVRPGWVMALDFVKIFELGVGNPKHAANRAVKRLRDGNCTIDSHTAGGSGPPKKLVKISDLRRHYNID